MDIASLTSLFGWMTVINFALLIFSTLMLTMFRTSVIRIHTRVTGLEENALKRVYLYFLGFYKVLIILFNLVPYLALKLI